MSGAAAPSIRFEEEGLRIGFPALFGAGGEGHCRRFLRRVFAFDEILSVGVEPAAGEAVLRCRLGGGERRPFLARLAAALGGGGAEWDDALLPAWTAGESLALHRCDGFVSLFEIVRAGPGRLRLSHPAIRRDAALGPRLEAAAKEFPGVRQAQATGSAGRLWVSCPPQGVDLLALARVLEAELAAPRTALVSLDADPARLGLANATLGLAALGEFALPVVLPVCVGMLVVSNLGTIREAGKQLGQGKLGLPVLYTALLGCSITTGQIVAHALMEWSFKFWERRSDAALAAEYRTLLERSLPLPAQARLVRSDAVDAKLPSAELRPGQRIRIEAPAAVPADGRVLSGVALVDQAAVSGARHPVRKLAGAEALAGSRLLGGSIEVEVVRTGARTQAAQVARHLLAGVRGLADDPVLRRQAEALAGRAVPATLAIAGLGWAVGGLFTAGAVMHQDHASGPKLAVPLETLRGMGAALRGGVVLRRGGALPRLAASRFLVLDDHPAWRAKGLELASLRSRLAAGEADKLLCHLAGAGLYLGDGRTEALLEACRQRGLVVRRPALVGLDAGRVTVRQGSHALTLREDGDEEAAGRFLRAEIDGEEVARLSFRPAASPRAAAAVGLLRQRGIQVFVLSSRPEAETERLARRLGADLHGGDFSPEEKIRFLQGLKKRGVAAAYVGAGPVAPALAGQAELVVSLGGLEGADGSADMLVLGDSLEGLVEAVDLAREHGARIDASCRRARLPNLLCIVGGYAGVLNGITSGLLANLGVYQVYQQASRSAGQAGGGRRP